MYQSRRGFLNFLRPLMTAGLPLMKSVLKHIAKKVLISLELTGALLATDATVANIAR